MPTYFFEQRAKTQQSQIFAHMRVPILKPEPYIIVVDEFYPGRLTKKGVVLKI